MDKYFIFFKVYSLLHICVALVNSKCTLKIPLEHWSKPSFEISIGTRQIKVPLFNDQVRLEDNQTLTGKCDTHFNDFEYMFKFNHEVWDYDYEMNVIKEQTTPTTVVSLHEITLVCDNGNLIYKTFPLITEELSCAPLQLGIYESDTPFPWCEETSSSYTLSTKSLGKDVHLAAACYDVERTALRNLRYFAGSKTSLDNYKELLAMIPTDLKNVNMTVEVTYFDKTLNHLRQDASRDPQQSNEICNIWLQFLRNVYSYENKPIVQGGAYVEYFGKFENFLETSWWSPLRLGNWKRVQYAIDEEAKSKAFNLYAGTSGTQILPMDKNCSENGVKRISFDQKFVPAYIWTYVQAVNKSEEFVIVAYNSPFYEFHRQEEIIICKDICDQIEWLKDARSTFRYATLGVIFCCDVNEVREHNYLDGFPLPNGSTEMDTTTLESDSIESDSTATLSELNDIN